MAKDIWISENWMKDPEIAKPGRRTGLRLRFDRDVDPDIRAAFKELAKWIRERFWFPVRVPVYVRSSKTVTARDGDQCVGTFLWPDDHSVEPYIRVAAGDYQDLVNEKGALQAKIDAYYDEESDARMYQEAAEKGEYLYGGGVLSRAEARMREKTAAASQAILPAAKSIDTGSNILPGVIAAVAVLAMGSILLFAKKKKK